VFITGGSAGLGLAIAQAYAKQGAKVSIVGRSEKKLKAAKETIEAGGQNQYPVFTYSTDVTQMKQVQIAVEKAIVFHAQGIDQLFCCAGLAQPGYFVEQDVDVFSNQMQVNYFGTLHAVKAVVPNMQGNQTAGRIVLVSSACGYIGFVGYTQYCATKYALRGFADALRNEMLMYGISVSIFYPGNMDTPGFELEEKTKPSETRKIEGSSKLVSAESAAASLMSGLANGTFAITNDFGVWLLRVVGNGMSPRSFTTVELLLSPLIVLIQVFYIMFMDHVTLRSRGKQHPNRY